MEGTLPPFIGKLAKLTYLSFGSTKVSGESAQLTRKSHHLIDHAGANRLTLCVCMGFCYVLLNRFTPRLRCFEGSIPSEIGKLTALTYLNLRSTGIAGG